MWAGGGVNALWQRQPGATHRHPTCYLTCSARLVVLRAARYVFAAACEGRWLQRGVRVPGLTADLPKPHQRALGVTT